MLSSVQCYNLMHNIQEDNLQHLQLFTEYGRLALEQSNEKPFQYLLFLIRDWQYAYEVDYGWYEQEVIDELLVNIDEQTPEMRELRQRINSSFEDIGAFLMPHPGLIVAQGENFTGDLNQIEPNFIKYTKLLTPLLFAPENLIVKKINGQNVRARDLVPYLQAYLKIFNEKSLPEPKSVLLVCKRTHIWPWSSFEQKKLWFWKKKPDGILFEVCHKISNHFHLNVSFSKKATAEANNVILQNDCLNLYVDSMQKSLDATQSYYNEFELDELHQRVKEKAIKQVYWNWIFLIF